MYEVAIEVTFDAAHRLLNYKGKCHNLHGHTYTAIIGVTREELVDAGFVIDFGRIKKFVKEWVNENWDHATILNRDDELVLALTGLSQDELTEVLEPSGLYTQMEAERRELLCSCLKEHRVVPMDGDPTAERMAKLLFDVMKASYPSEFTKVTGITSAVGYPLEMHSEKVENPIAVQYVSIKETVTSMATFRSGEGDVHGNSAGDCRED